jgi:hypothetical protein
LSHFPWHAPPALFENIIKLDQYKNLKEEWDNCTDRDKDKVLRSVDQFKALDSHPLKILFDKESELGRSLNQWTDRLNLRVGQYNALLDVYGQYGEVGLTKLFDKWTSLTSNKPEVFEKTFKSILSHMPSFNSMIDSERFDESMETIFAHDDNKLSWWNALIENHNQYEDLFKLSSIFNSAMGVIEGKMNLTIPAINDIKFKKDLPTTLSRMIKVLENCPIKDRQAQLDYLCELPDIPEDYDYQFLVPQMFEEGISDKEKNFNSTLKVLKTVSNPSSLEGELKSDKHVICIFYEKLAKRKQRLPLNTYSELYSATTCLDS